MLEGLLRGQNLDKAVGKRIEGICLGQVKIKGSGIELGKDIDPPQIGVYAV
jgi:hypothetical protein